MNTAEIAQIEDPAIWAVDSKIKLQSGVFNLHNREYQLEPITPIKRLDSEGHEILSAPRRMCYMKGTQGGFTELEVIRSLHGLIHRRYPRGIGYYFPNNDDVLEFGKNRFNPLIQSNRNAIGKYVKSGGRGTDTSSLKKIGNGFLWLRGARMTRKIDDQAVSTKTSSIPLDRFVFDELDLMADSDSEFSVIGKARGRLGDSLYKEECYISNPTTPGFGIDTLFALSDKRHWFRYCDHCSGHTTCAELFFMEDPEKCVRLRPDGSGYIACKVCGRELRIFPGEWVPTDRDKTDYMRGYQWGQLTSIRNDPAEILREYRNPPEGNLSEVIRLRLGWPHISTADKLRMEDVLACCDDTLTPRNNHPGPCAMGLDCMKAKNLIIGARLPNGGRIIYGTWVIPGEGIESWNYVADLCNRFNVKSGVIDIRPYEDMARYFQKSYAHKMKIWLCEYKETTPLGTIFNPNTGLVQVARTELLDATHRMITTQGELVLPRRGDNIMEFARQVCSSFKVLDTNKQTGQKVYRYRKTNIPDHFRHALGYFYLASDNKRIGTVDRQAGKKKKKYVTVNNKG
ncbi:MAG: phage terminase large subunit family protein [Sedimentisphaerales bacterium]|nr:phage terminase large subunit family protein [Sedimentisphaerales bacterium]